MIKKFKVIAYNYFKVIIILITDKVSRLKTLPHEFFLIFQIMRFPLANCITNTLLVQKDKLCLNVVGVN